MKTLPDHAVEVFVFPFSFEGAPGAQLTGVETTCSRCGNTAQALGSSSRHVARCLKRLRDTCPTGQRNNYEPLAD